MNKRKVFEMIRPFVKGNQLTYEKFDEIFCMLSQKEKYSVANFLNDELEIFLVDEEDFATTQENFHLVDYILAAVKPYVENQQLTYDEFDKIFSSLDKRKQYEITGILYASSIELVDEKILSAQPKETVIHKEHEIKASNSVLVRLAQNGDRQALHDLLIKNRGLVYKYAKRYEKFFNHSLSFEDLVQAGMLGMLKAVEEFDLSKETQFTTYAYHWINQSISRTIYDTGFNIRMPVHIFESINKVLKLDYEFTFFEENFSARIELIAKELNVSADKVREIFSHQYKYLNLTSLDTPVGEDSDITIGDFLEDYDAPTPFDIVAKKILNERLMEIFSTLTSREKQVLLFRFGFYGDRERTLEEVGKYFGLTRERIRQIEKKALAKLRHPSRSRKLKEWLY